MIDELRRHRRNQPRRSHADTELPRPEHDVEVILPADFAPCRENRADRDQEFDDQERAKQMLRHVDFL